MDFNLILAAAYGILIVVLFNLFFKRRRETKEHISKVSAPEFNKLKSGGQLIDVRTKEEYNTEHIVGARNIPIKNFENIETKLIKDKSILVYAKNGRAALKAAYKLVKKGFSNIIVMNDTIDNYEGKKTN